jgi:hypothetical protein
MYIQGSAQNLLECLNIFSNKLITSWSKSLLFFNFMVKIKTFFAEWWSGGRPYRMHC